MDSLKYLLTRVIRLNSLPTDDFDKCIGRVAGATNAATAKAVVGYAKGGTRYVGTRLVDYNRIDLATAFKNIVPVAAMYRAKNHREVFQTILEKYGLPGADDATIVNECNSVALDPNNPPTKVTLTIGAGKLYRGSLEVQIVTKIMPLDVVVPLRELSVMVPRLLLSNTKLVNERRYYHFDFSDAVNNASLRTMAVGWRHGNSASWFSELITSPEVIQECGGIWWGWGTTGNVAYNLYGVECIYNGPTSGYPDANQNYSKVAVIDEGTGYGSTNTNRGKLILHYN